MVVFDESDQESHFSSINVVVVVLILDLHSKSLHKDYLHNSAVLDVEH